MQTISKTGMMATDRSQMSSLNMVTILPRKTAIGKKSKRVKLHTKTYSLVHWEASKREVKDLQIRFCHLMMMMMIKVRETQATSRKVKTKTKMVVKRKRERRKRSRMSRRHRLAENACESNLVDLIQTVMWEQQMRVPVEGVHIRERTPRNQVKKRRAVLLKSSHLLRLGERFLSRIVTMRTRRRGRRGSIGAIYSLERNEISLMTHLRKRRRKRKLKRSPRLQLQTCLREIEG